MDEKNEKNMGNYLTPPPPAHFNWIYSFYLTHIDNPQVIWLHSPLLEPWLDFIVVISSAVYMDRDTGVRVVP